jgi:tetratricopeptide (TPR) repeat protein
MSVFDQSNQSVETQLNAARDINLIIEVGSKQSILPSNIPSPKGFIGREDDLNALRKAKTRRKTSFVLHGPGGVGKTDLALKFIEENQTDDRKAYQINMLGLSKNLTSWQSAMLEVIRNFRPDVPADLSEQDIENLYNRLLNEHKPILFFDNAKDREQVEPLNNASAFVVITSRTKFNVTEGFSFEVEQMTPNDARKLLFYIESEERFEGEADNIAKLAGYLPMALLPLASLLTDDVTLKAKKLVERYSDRKELLLLADPNRKNLSVMASFDLSYETLSNELKECWRKLSVFPADFDLEAMRTVWQMEDGTKERSELVGKHLLEYELKSERSRLHDIARDYTKVRISVEERAESEYLYCFHYGKILEPLQSATLENLEIFDIERTNIEYGFNWLSERAENDSFFAFLVKLYTFYPIKILYIRLNFRELITWLETGLTASRKDNEKALEFSHLINIASVYASSGEPQKAIDCLEQVLPVIKDIGAPSVESKILGKLGDAYNELKEYQKAIEYLEQALIIASEIGDRDLEGLHLCNLGCTYIDIWDCEKAIDYLNQSLKIAREFGNRQSEGYRLGNLGNAYLKLGDYRKAIDYYEQSRIALMPFRSHYSDGLYLANLGAAYAGLGENEIAKQFYLEAIKILESIGSPSANLYRRNLAKLEN